jgi:hypothetical protein
MPTPIAFTVTDAGRIAALDAYTNGLSITLETLRASTGKVTPTGGETALTGTARGSWTLGGGEVDAISSTLRFFALVQSATTITDIFSLGLFTDDDVLFAIASTTGSDPLIVCHANIDFLPSFGITMPDVAATAITIETDPNAPLAQVLMTQHQAAEDAHPQYLKANVQGTEAVLGMFKVATTAQTNSGLADNLAITPLKLKQRLEALAYLNTTGLISLLGGYMSGTGPWAFKIPGVLEIKFGKKQLLATQDTPVTFTNSFDVETFVVLITIQAEASGLEGNDLSVLDTYNEHGFTITHNAGPSTNRDQVFWIAIGR